MFKTFSNSSCFDFQSPSDNKLINEIQGNMATQETGNVMKYTQLTFVNLKLIVEIPIQNVLNV